MGRYFILNIGAGVNWDRKNVFHREFRKYAPKSMQWK